MNVIPQRRQAAHPHSFLLGRRNFIANSFPRDFSFKLRKGEQDIQHQSPRGGRGIDGLRDGGKGDPMGIKEINELGKVS